MEYIEETYCIGCGSELISTGNDPLTEEAYFTCPSCNMGLYSYNNRWLYNSCWNRYNR